ncbi:DUF2163 domain-containing protein [Methylocystis heyeri]|uniref:DUF2163 domain-containing protein n=1 Tax=Methylocystis heyeri TaxID=391905 RepID=A0A6B8KDR4_9HYPH|nr:DUF2163 domain-containing protein [Methylocystis heyeri]QGM45839.1 DUF2163 domain-containing protein [Methylocystis heyeri]
MKQASPALVAFLAEARGTRDCAIAFAECFTFTQATGAVFSYTNADVPVIYRGKVFLANGPLVSGLKYRASTGLNVDRQEIVIAARPEDLAGWTPLLAALREGFFDGCVIQRDRVFFSDFVGGTLVDGVTLFHGRLSTVDEVGRTRARITVANELVLLDVNMPRNIFAPTCIHTLYDQGCKIPSGAFSTNDVVGSGSTRALINFAGAQAAHAQGTLLFSSGANSGRRCAVKSVVPGVSVSLIYPLPTAPAAGDALVAFWGCDHTMATCQARFSNLPNFRGFPFVPPPQMAM